MAVRNACEGNTTNQDYVDSLQPQGDATIVDEAMQAAGVGVQFDPKTNKFKLKREE